MFLPQIDHADEGHLAVIHSLSQGRELVLFCKRVVVTLERRRGAAEQHHGLFNPGSDDGDVARVIARCFFLLVRSFVLLIHHDQPELFQRREDGATCADYDSGTAGMDFMPFIVPLALGQVTV